MVQNNQYEFIEDVVAKIEYIERTTNSDTEYVRAIQKMAIEIREEHNL